MKRLKAETAFVSGAKEGAKHPAKKITNALKKQKVGDNSTKVVIVRGTQIRHGYNAPDREGWESVPEEPFHDRVEE